MGRLMLLYLMVAAIFFITLPGCISSPEVNPSLKFIDIEEELIFHPLEYAIGALESDDGMRMAKVPNYTIHTIIGENITKEGDAKTWILAVKAEKPFYFIYSGGGFTTMDWHEDNPGHAINFNRILLPSELLSRNSQRINSLYSGQSSGIRELELNNGKYYIRGFSDGIEWQYIYDAVTGREIS